MSLDVTPYHEAQIICHGTYATVEPLSTVNMLAIVEKPIQASVELNQVPFELNDVTVEPIKASRRKAKLSHRLAHLSQSRC